MRPDNALWYKDAVIYELHVRAFSDSDGDGVGDFRGLTERLDYLQDLGANVLWLLPFCPSPWKDDGYDISDYTNVHPAYGTLKDFQTFLKQAHKRGLRVVTELVLNHTSDQHPWFQRARKASPGSSSRDFYVWSDSPNKYKEARIIFKDFESSNWTWDAVAKAYYWHRFYSHQPDLNFENPEVHEAVLQAVDFWFDLGVDGLRLDAVPYLYEREGTSCENLPETHTFLKKLRDHVDGKYSERMLLAEANQWPEDAVAYFGGGDECQMAFHFPVMPRLFMAIKREDRFPIVDILEQTPEIPENCQWAMFLRNHDELTLEMVTDEERDYMYRAYAHEQQMRINLGIRRRLAPLLGNHRRRIELMNSVLFALPGTPVIYNGDEIGMGDNIYLGDRDGVRTPMQWNPDRNAGFSKANPHKLYLPIIIDPEYHYEAINVEAQQSNPHSLLWWTKRLIALRKRSLALSRGSLEFLHPENHRVLAFLRRYGDEQILVVANLSRFSQPVEMDLSHLNGMVPIELFGKVEFPPIGELPYFITLAPHGFYSFSLEHPKQNSAYEVRSGREAQEIPLLAATSWQALLEEESRAGLEGLLPDYLKQRRWFLGRLRVIRSARVVEAIPFPPSAAYFFLVELYYNQGEPETYVVPLALATGERAVEILRHQPAKVIARLGDSGDETGVLYAADGDQSFCEGLLDAIGRRRRFKGSAGELHAMASKQFRQLRGTEDSFPAESRADEQNNSSIVFGQRFIFKLFRHLEEGINPDLEIGRFLTEKTHFRNVPPVAGSIEYRRKDGSVSTLGILTRFVSNEGDAWRHALDALGRFFERAMARSNNWGEKICVSHHPLDLVDQEFPEITAELIPDYIGDARLLGQRTAELHLELGREQEDPSFAHEPFTDFYRQGLYHGMVGLANRSVQLLRQKGKRLPEEIRSAANEVVEREAELRNLFRPIRDRRITGMRIRHHGDYHLGQVLFTGKDYIIIDFEGEAIRSMGERRIKRSPLRDVASMLRSYHYVSCAALFGQAPGIISQQDTPKLESWARFWYSCVSSAFLKGYLNSASVADFLPNTREELRLLLDAFMLEKAVYEISHELDHRPDWVRIPLEGVLTILGAKGTVDVA